MRFRRCQDRATRPFDSFSAFSYYTIPILFLASFKLPQNSGSFHVFAFLCECPWKRLLLVAALPEQLQFLGLWRLLWNVLAGENQKPGGKGQCIFAFLTEELPLIK